MPGTSDARKKATRVAAVRRAIIETASSPKPGA
jgi:hypothetical protein